MSEANVRIDDIPDMVAALRSGDLMFDDAYHLCLELFSENPVESVVTQLPPELQRRFRANLIAEFDNSAPADEFVLFDSSRGRSPRAVLVVNEVRAYLERIGVRSLPPVGGQGPVSDDQMTVVGHVGAEAARVAPCIRMMRFEVGSEFAPDAPWGGEVLCLYEDGRVRYENRNHGVIRSVNGIVPVTRVDALFELVRSVGLPGMPAHRMPPGSSVARLALLGDSGETSVTFSCYYAETLPVYTEWLAVSSSLCEALRTGNAEQLTAWGFVSARSQ